MPRILPGIPTLKQHLERLDLDPEAYRPDCCPHCGKAGVWFHGHYRRKADWVGARDGYRDPVPIPAFTAAPAAGPARACRPVCPAALVPMDPSAGRVRFAAGGAFHAGR